MGQWCAAVDKDVLRGRREPHTENEEELDM